MDFEKLAAARYSVRAYKSDPVPDEVLNRILDAARNAPTAANKQPFKIIVIRTEGRQEELGRVYSREWFTQAPLVLAICAVTEEAWIRKFDEKSYSFVDAAIVFDYLILAATDLGLGTCWIAAFDPVAAREVLGLPEGVEPVAFTPLGYAVDEQKPKQRKEPTVLVKYERW